MHIFTIELSKYNLNPKSISKLNDEIKKSDLEYVLLIDDRNCLVQMKQSCIELMQLALDSNPNAGMVYADYEFDSDGKIEQIHLLKHHIGRVRDNQDYGKVFLVRKSIFDKIGGFNESLHHNHLYDLRLKFSEISDLLHISDKVNAALYRIKTDANKANVFDYLLSDENIQKEAEKILTDHLKRINAFLSPEQQFKKRPIDKFKYIASVIIPVNNRPNFICDAIESAQNQTIQDIEIIVVVNGGNEDPTDASVKKYMDGGKNFKADKPTVKLVTIDINNIGFSLNCGVNHAEGEFYVQLDSDDQLIPHAVEKIIATFETDPTIGMVLGSYEVWEKLKSGEIIRDKSIPTVTHSEWTDDNGRNNLLRINGAGAPRAIPIQLIKDIGYFEMNEYPFARNYGEDYDMVLRISEQYKIGRIYDPIYKVIRHDGGTDHSIDQATINRNDEAKDWMRKLAIQRRQEINGTK